MSEHLSTRYNFCLRVFCLFSRMKRYVLSYLFACRRRQSSSSINPLHSIFHSQAPTVEETTSSMGRDDNSNASNINNNDYEHIGYEEP